MANIISSTSQTYAGTDAVTTKIVGRNAGKNYVARYQFSTDAKGANRVSWSLPTNYAGEGAVPPLRWYITASSSSHINAGASTAEHYGAVTVTDIGAGSYTFSGSADIILLPNTIYYLWIFPNTTTYGFYWLKQSGTATLSTAGAALSIMSVSGVQELGAALAIAVTRYSNSFAHTITYSCGNASGTVCTKSNNTSISFVLPIDLARQNTAGTSVSVAFSVDTYDGNALIGTTTKTISCAIPESVKPSCVVSVTDPTGNANFYGAYIKGISKFAVVIKPTLSQESPIASYKATANGMTYVSDAFATDLLQDFGNLVVSATVTDKRGRGGSDSKTLTVIDYAPPSISTLKVKRCDENGTENDQGEYVQVMFSASATPLNNRNTATYTLEYKKATEATYSAVALTAYSNSYSVTDGAYIFAADTGSTYEIRLTLTDAFNTVETSTVASTAFTIMHFKADGTGMAIGKISEEANMLDIAMDALFRGDTWLENALGIASGGTGVKTVNELVQLVFDNSNAAASVRSYPDKAGIYRTIGTNIFQNLSQPHSDYGVLAILRAYYAAHIYVDAYGNVFIGYTGDTFKEPVNWISLTQRGTCISRTMLWENPSPTSEFLPQTVSGLGLDNYDMYEVLYWYSTAYAYEQYTLARSGQSTILSICSETTGRTGGRPVYAENGNLRFGEAGYSQTPSQNAYCIPVAIYGIRLEEGGGSGGGSGGGGTGEDGGYYVPSVDASGNLRWTASKSGMPSVAAANIKGEKGDTGPQGAAGYAPARGTDYWTDADIAEIKSYVDEAILGGAW